MVAYTLEVRSRHAYASSVYIALSRQSCATIAWLGKLAELGVDQLGCLFLAAPPRMLGLLWSLLWALAWSVVLAVCAAALGFVALLVYGAPCASMSSSLLDSALEGTAGNISMYFLVLPHYSTPPASPARD